MTEAWRRPRFSSCRDFTRSLYVSSSTLSTRLCCCRESIRFCSCSRVTGDGGIMIGPPSIELESLSDALSRSAMVHYAGEDNDDDDDEWRVTTPRGDDDDDEDRDEMRWGVKVASVIVGCRWSSHTTPTTRGNTEVRPVAGVPACTCPSRLCVRRAAVTHRPRQRMQLELVDDGAITVAWLTRGGHVLLVLRGDVPQKTVYQLFAPRTRSPTVFRDRESGAAFRDSPLCVVRCDWWFAERINL